MDEKRKKTRIETRKPHEAWCSPDVPATTGEQGKRGVAAFFGTWPGDETDEDFERMLDEVRGHDRNPLTPRPLSPKGGEGGNIGE